jgi:hypothetical protein
VLEKVGVLYLVELVGFYLPLIIKVVFSYFTNCALREPFVCDLRTNELILIGIFSKQGLNRPDVFPSEAHLDLYVVAHINIDNLVYFQ